MVKFYPSIREDHQEWLMQQPVFFVASAPLRGKHVNLSPKGVPSASLCVLSPNEIAYIDATGSGNETLSHVQENGRLTLMFCSFDAAPRIYRLFCTGKVIECHDPAFTPMVARMGMTDKSFEGARSVIHLDVFKTQTSCGYGVPRISLTTDPETQEPKPFFQTRDTISLWAEKQVKNGTMEDYRVRNNMSSLDGLPGMRAAMKRGGVTRLGIALRVSLSRHKRVFEMLGVMLFTLIATVLGLWGYGLTTF